MIKEFDHCLDGDRYALFTHFGETLGEQEPDMDQIYAEICGTKADLPGIFSDQMQAFGQYH